MGFELHIDPSYRRTCRLAGPAPAELRPGQVVTIESAGPRLEIHVSPMEELTIHGGRPATTAVPARATVRLCVDPEYEGTYCFTTEPTGRDIDVHPGRAVDITPDPADADATPLIVRVGADGAVAFDGPVVTMTSDDGRRLYP
ncbi:hypothetical protein AB0M46_50100 [Dactylosporangium sp. NPDC051485]|uniref:hypothetical protein n=1 Tax=Dactylosporangium sp. NPDC051485 TaxID=3154846 RepID=UPI00342554CB